MVVGIIFWSGLTFFSGYMTYRHVQEANKKSVQELNKEAKEKIPNLAIDMVFTSPPYGHLEE